MKKDIKYYIGLNYPVTLEKNPEGGFSIEIPDLPGCHAYGKTLKEAWERLQKAKEAWISVSIEKGFPIEEPVENQFSGKLLLRIPPKLHAKLAKGAKRNRVSLNRYMQTKLEDENNIGLFEKKFDYIVNKLNMLEERIVDLSSKRDKTEGIPTTTSSSIEDFAPKYIN